MAPINYRKEAITGIKWIPCPGSAEEERRGLSGLAAPSAVQSGPGLDSSQVGAGSHPEGELKLYY